MIRRFTEVTAYGWDGSLYRKKKYSGVFTKERIRKLQSRWDRQYGGFMKYEIKELVLER